MRKRRQRPAWAARLTNRGTGSHISAPASAAGEGAGGAEITNRAASLGFPATRRGALFWPAWASLRFAAAFSRFPNILRALRPAERPSLADLCVHLIDYIPLMTKIRHRLGRLMSGVVLPLALPGGARQLSQLIKRLFPPGISARIARLIALGSLPPYLALIFLSSILRFPSGAVPSPGTLGEGVGPASRAGLGYDDRSVNHESGSARRLLAA